jgi:hypothetical protein
MNELRLMVPTHVGELQAQGVDLGTDTDYGDPQVPVIIHEADGVRVVLGTHEYLDCEAADIQIERRLNGWAIFLHPLPGGDPCGYVYFLDDGRSFLVPEWHGVTETIRVVERRPPEIDLPAPTAHATTIEVKTVPRRFRFEISGSIGFTVEANSEHEALEKAKAAREKISSKTPNLGLSADYDACLAFDEGPPELVEELDDQPD